MVDVEKKKLAEEVRKRINQDSSKYSPKDIARLNTEDWWINAFLSTNNNDLDVSTAVFMECLRWRVHFGVEKISMLELRSIFERKVMYFHGTSYSNATILWLNLANHRATDKDAEKLLVYWLERHMTETQNGQICLLVDMTNVRNQNMDFDFIKFLLRCFKYYYPNCLSSLLFYEPPSKFSAQMKVIRSYMDEKFLALTENISRSFISDIIPVEVLPPHMGGQDNFVFTMDELARCVPQKMTTSESSIESTNRVNGVEYELPPKPQIDTPLSKRSVKFEEDEDIQRNGPLQLTRNGAARSSSSTRKPGQVPENLRPIIEAKLNSDDSNWLVENFLSVCPKETLFLTKVAGESDLVDLVILKNTSDTNVLFKIKTTSPEKFRVRPSMGVVKPGGIEAVRLYLQSEYKNSSRMERFLLMALKANTENTDEFSNIWKSAPESEKFERKLSCRLGDEMTDSTSKKKPRPIELSTGISSENEALIASQIRQISQQQTIIIGLLCFVLFVQFLIVLYIRGLSSGSSTTDEVHEDL